MMISYAQNFEDVILERIFKDVRQGFYVDIGACHPIFDSVTQHFYLKGWSGINVEPQPALFAELRRERERDINLNFCIGEKVGRQTLYITTDLGTSTLDATLADRYRNAGRITAALEVEVISLNDLWREHVAGRPVDFLKIDVEGFEKAVLEGTDFTIVAPSVLVIESVHPCTREPTYQSWEPYLTGYYQLCYFDGLNRFYRRRDFSLDHTSCSVPPNVFDDFKTYREHASERACSLLSEQDKLLRTQLENVHASLAQKDAALDDAARAYQDLQNRNQSYAIQLRNFQTWLAQKDAALDDADRAYKELQIRNESYETQLRNFETWLAQKDSALEGAAQVNKDLRAAIQSYETQLQAFQAWLAQKDVALDEAAHAYKDLHARIELDEAQLHELQAWLAQKEFALDDAARAYKDLQTRIKSYETQLQNFETWAAHKDAALDEAARAYKDLQIQLNEKLAEIRRISNKGT